jgi:hypothetical protein
MTKTATVHAQQMWEYMELTRKTASYMLRELNDHGQQGWELVSMMQGKDRKNEAAWIAFLKRPYVSHGASPPTHVAVADEASSPSPAHLEPSQAKSGSASEPDDEFELEEPEDLFSASDEQKESPTEKEQ